MFTELRTNLSPLRVLKLLGARRGVRSGQELAPRHLFLGPDVGCSIQAARGTTARVARPRSDGERISAPSRGVKAIAAGAVEDRCEGHHEGGSEGGGEGVAGGRGNNLRLGALATSGAGKANALGSQFLFW